MARSATTRCEFCGHRYIRPCTAEMQAECGNTKLAIEPQVSIRHHYIPVFYSKRWCDGDGKICEYSRPRDKIYDRRVVPKGTGFQDQLYETKGVPKLIAQRIEDDFMSSVDNHAAEALKLLETDAPKINGDQKHKSAWSLFLLSLLMRTPEDVAALVGIWDDDWERDLPVLREQYEKKKKPGETRSLEEFIAQEDPDVKAKWAMSELPDLIDHQGIGQLLNNMHWFVITTKADVPRLLTSDRPLFVSGKLGAPDCYLTLPIAPDRLFVAVPSQDAEAAFRAQPQQELIEATNVRTAEHAVKYVYGDDNAMLKFVDKYISSARQPSYFENVRKLRKERHASRTADNPKSPTGSL
ncbi:hypothetical protein ACVILK_005429 [Bradyrhizobium embrapense]